MTLRAVDCYVGVSRNWAIRLVTLALMIAALGEPGWAGNKPEWIELRSPNFIVVTNAGEGQARKTARQFEMIRAVFREYFGQTGASAEQPVIILAGKDEKTLKDLLPEYWEKKGSAHPAGVYLGGTDTDYIALRLDVSLDQEAYEPYEPVYHEYVHYLTRRLIAKMPLWMVEGLAEFYGNIRVESNRVYVGAPSTSNVLLLREKPLLPLATLIAIDSSSPYYHEESKTSIFYAESWALTHYLMARDWKDKTHRMTDFVRLLQAGTDPKAAAGQTVGDLQALDGSLGKYVQNRLFLAAPMEAPKINENGFQVHSITDAEALAIRADFLGHNQHNTEAQQMLKEALKADPKLGIAYESLAFLALQRGNIVDAEKAATQAVTLNPESYRANYYYAWSLLRGGGSRDEETLNKAEAALRKVVKNNTEFAPAYDALAYVLELQGGKEKLDEAYMMTLQASAREPGNVFYRVRGVEVLERQRRAEDAIRVATLAESMAKTPQERDAASAALTGVRQFKESWERMQALQTAENSRAAQGNVESRDVAPALIPGMSRQVNVSAGVLILSDPQGVDFNPYLSKDVMPKIQKAWAEQIQKVSATSAGRKGTVVVEFAIEKDGSISRIKLRQSTTEDELDEAVGAAIQGASPFPPLPAKYRGKEILLRFQCDYNAASAEAGPSGSGK